VVDTLLTLINSGTTLGDGVVAGSAVSSDGILPNNVFPFVHESEQPRGTGVLDDGTRN